MWDGQRRRVRIKRSGKVERIWEEGREEGIGKKVGKKEGRDRYEEEEEKEEEGVGGCKQVGEWEKKPDDRVE